MARYGAQIGLLAVGLSAMVVLSACSTSHKTTETTTRTTGQSAVREMPVPSSGAGANQAAWEQGKVPEELQKMPSANSKPPVPGENSYTSTTAPTGEVRTMPKPYAASNHKKAQSASASTQQNQSQQNE